MMQKFFHACLLFFAGVFVLYLAVLFLARFWVWLVLIGVIVLGGWVAYRVIQARRNRW